MRIIRTTFTIISFLGIACSSLLAKPLKVVTTTTMITDLVQNLAGEHAQVDGLMGPGVDPHLYKASAQDVSKLQQADIIFFNGLHLEGRMADLFERLQKRGRDVYPISAHLDPKLLIHIESDGETTYDPHIWMNPDLWAGCIQYVAECLSEHDPVHAALYEANATQLREEYYSLFNWAHDQVETIPGDQRILITSHDAYNYFGQAFGFHVVGVQGVSTVSEAGLADIASIVDFINEHKIKAYEDAH